MATPEIETVNSGLDNAKIGFAVLLVIAGFLGFYYTSRQGALVQWGVLVGGIVLAAAVFLLSETGKRFLAFAKDSWRELKKVVWPTRKEALQMTAIVMAFALVMALFLWLTDKTVEWALYDVILGWRR